MTQPYGWWLPINVSTHGAAIDNLLVVVHWFMLILFVGWGIYLLYVLCRFRARPGHSATPHSKHFKLPTYLEIGIAIFEVFLLVAMSYPVWAKLKTDFPPENESTIVRVVAEQFSWTIHYPGRDGKFGRTDLKLIDGTNPVGLDREDPAGKDDILSPNILHIPVNKPVIAHLSSKDVIHSFSLPVMRIKQDVVPGMTIPVWFEATQTGQFEIACAQLCGNSHYRMKGQFIVDTPEAFDSWLSEEEKSLQ